MSFNELVSVVIPAYNHEQYIEEAIQSVIEQSYPCIELIVIDDGSSDCTWQIINQMREKCENRFVNTIFQSQDNQGTCLTLNRLIALSSGQFIQFLASDDKLSSDSVKILYDFLSISPDYALAVGKNEFIDSNSNICYWDASQNIVYDKQDAKYLSFTDLLSERVNLESEQFGSYAYLLRANHVPNGYLIRKTIFDKIESYTPNAPLEDYWLMLQISKYAKLKYIDKTTFYYRWHMANTVKQHEKMKAIAKKTLQYEFKQVYLAKNQTIISIINQLFCKNKVYFYIPFIVKLYKTKNPIEKKIHLHIFSKDLVLYHKLY